MLRKGRLPHLTVQSKYDQGNEFCINILIRLINRSCYHYCCMQMEPGIPYDTNMHDFA